MLSRLDLLNTLRERIPDMECIPGCTQCCGHTAWSRFEWEQILEERRKEFDPFSFKCSFCKGGKCSVHPHRSIICRMFGVVAADGMRCPMGVVPSKRLSKVEADLIGTEYVKTFFKGEAQ